MAPHVNRGRHQAPARTIGSAMDRAELKQHVKRLAAEAGFELCGVCLPGAIEHRDYLRNWLESGRAGTMAYLHRHIESREDITKWLPWARSLIVVGLNYRQPAPTVPAEDARPRGKVAMYAWGRDYHVVLRERLQGMIDRLHDALSRSFEYRICVDTAAIVEREIAAAAGIGWIGKNTLVLHPRLGSQFFIGVVATDLQMAPDVPIMNHCGSCTRCLDACPTDAFPAPHEMDARRCVSYLTIEHRDELPPSLSHRLGEWVFGCDDCQTACPFNHWEINTRESEFMAGSLDAARPLLDDILSADPQELKRAHKHRATSRAKPDMWKRNAAAVMNGSRART